MSNLPDVVSGDPHVPAHNAERHAINSLALTLADQEALQTAVGIGGMTAYGRALLLLANQAALQAAVGISGTSATASSSTTPGAAFTVLASHLSTIRTLTLNANLTVTLDSVNPPSTVSDTVTIIFKQPATGGPYTVTLPTLEWPDDAVAPAIPSAANAELVVELWWTGLAWRATALRFYP